MKRISQLCQTKSLRDGDSSNRKGSILVVVIALLGMLLLLGIAFFTFASQEQASAEFYSDSTKFKEPGFSVETLFNFGMEQLITGPIPELKQSALWGRRHSLMANMLGLGGNANPWFDRIPHNGAGVHLILDSNNLAQVDNDLDGSADTMLGGPFGNLPGQLPLNFNISPAANGGSPPANLSYLDTFEPDVDYTYPDINNVFLAYVGNVNEDVNGRKVIIPSFHRPQYLRTGTGQIPVGGAEGTNWYDHNSNADIPKRLLRPHPMHVITGSSIPRYIRSSTANPSTVFTNPVFDIPVTNVLGKEVDPFPFKISGGTGKMGVWTLDGDNDYEFDADNDGDGVNEGVWLDLDHPIQTLPDGRKYIPLFSFTVVDAGGLINLNTAGNLNQAVHDDVPLFKHPMSGYSQYLYGASNAIQFYPVSTSNLGVSRSEINPLWALSSWTNDDILDVETRKKFEFFRTFSSTDLDGSMKRLAIANMELIHLKNGQKYDGGGSVFEYNVGTWGEASTLASGGFADPGVAGTDDDDDAESGLESSDPLIQKFSSIPFPSVNHPLDLRGLGFCTIGTADGAIADLTGGIPGDPSRWLTYTDYLDPGDATASNLQNWNSYFSGGSPVSTSLVATLGLSRDEADETVVEPLLSNTTGKAGKAIKNDSVFSPDEMLGLHAAESDYKSVNGTSRLRDLAPVNMEVSDVREQFTSISFDKAVYGAPLSRHRWWEWDNVNGFGDAFRSEFNEVFKYRYRIGLNGLLVGMTPATNQMRSPIYRALTPHPTTAFSNNPITAPSSITEPPPLSMSPNDQEYYARRDRQLLARDIYALLYVGGTGLNVSTAKIDPPFVVGKSLYSDAQLKEMAQFAVNIVDALDRDNVITRFEYDKDLVTTDWDLDNDPYTTTDGGIDRGEVFGVEAQQLTLSESMLLKTTVVASDSVKTTFPDDVDVRYFSFLELRNTSPSPIPLGVTTGDLGAWRIRVVKNPTGQIGLSPPETERFLYLIPGNTTDPVNAGGPVPAGGQLTIGSRSGSDIDATTMMERPSDFRVDYDSDTDIDTIVPAVASASTPLTSPNFAETSTTPGSDLDLVTHISSTRFKLYDKIGTQITAVGSNALVDASITSSDVGFVLERLANPLRPASDFTETAKMQDNPWIPVDRMTVPATAFHTFNVNTEADTTGLASKKSWERKEALDIASEAAFGDPGNPYVSNSIGSPKNYNTVSSYSKWQPHFDREFTSVIDLLSVPLYGTSPFSNNSAPLTLNDKIMLEQVTTNRLVRSQDMSNSFYSDLLGNSDVDLSTAANDYLGVEFVAAKKFLRPDYLPDTDPNPIPALGTPTPERFDNRWHRVLEHLEVPSQTNRAVQWQFGEDVNGNGMLDSGEDMNGNSALDDNIAIQWPNTSQSARMPGTINLNGIRHQGVLAALIDDPDDSSTASPLIEGHFDLSTAPSLGDKYEPSRNWWHQFITTRDRRDPVTHLVLPGLPWSRPYRSLSYLDATPAIESTILRTLTLDTEDLDGDNAIDPGEDIDESGTVDTNISDRKYRRNLFEARTVTDAEGVNAVDFHTRHRLLRKISNNSTTRSDVFIVWMSVGFFEAVEHLEDANNNGILDPGEDLNANGQIDRLARIGARLKDSKQHRGFYVVDRSLTEKAAIEVSPFAVRFDYKKFIVYQKTLK